MKFKIPIRIMRSSTIKKMEDEIVVLKASEELLRRQIGILIFKPISFNAEFIRNRYKLQKSVEAAYLKKLERTVDTFLQTSKK